MAAPAKAVCGGAVKANCAATGIAVNVPMTWMDWSRLAWRESLIDSGPLTFAVAEALIRAYTVVVASIPPASGYSVKVVAKPDWPVSEILLPVGADNKTVSPLLSALPPTLKLVAAPGVPGIVAGNVNEVTLTFSVGVA
jgi:hypothetical protein